MHGVSRKSTGPRSPRRFPISSGLDAQCETNALASKIRIVSASPRTMLTIQHRKSTRFSMSFELRL